MPLRHASLVVPVLSLACSSASSSNQTHGPVVDAADDTAMDNLPDGSPDVGASDAGKEAGHKDGGHRGGGHDAQADSGASDATTDGPVMKDAASCKGTVALAGGTTSVAFSGTSVNGGAWNVSSLPGTSASGNPSLLGLAGGFMAVFTASGTYQLDWSAYTSSAWSAAASADGATCAGAPTAFGAPGLSPIGSTTHSVYLGTDNHFYHGTYTKKAGWDCESDPLTFGGTASFGPSAPSAASAGSSLVALFDGSDTNLYTQTWTAGAWAAAQQVAGATVGTVPPTLLALTGGSSDLLAVYEDASDYNRVYWTARSAGTWSTPALTNTNAYTVQPAALAPLPSGGAVLVFLGTDANPYGMTFDPKASPAWTPPAALLTGGLPLASAPTVAAGICGADAIAAIVQPAGVELVTLSSGSWSSPTLVGSTASMTYAAIATEP